MAISCLQNTNSLPAIDPQLILTDSLIDFVYEQIQVPDFSLGPYLNEAPTTHNNAETIPQSGGSYFNLATTTQNNAETTPEQVGSYLNLAPATHNNAETTPESVDSCLNMAPTIHNNTEINLKPVSSCLNMAPTTHNNTETNLKTISSCLNLAPTAHNNAESINVSVGSYLDLVSATNNNAETNTDRVRSYLNLVPITHNNAETESDPVGSFLNLSPTTNNNAEMKPEQVGYYLNQVPPTHNNTDTRPEPVGFYLNPVPTTYNNTEPKPETAQVPTSNSFPIGAPCIPFQYQDSYCTNAQNTCIAKAEVTPSQFVQYHQVCGNQFGTASVTNQVNILYQSTGFPVMLGTGDVKELMVPEFKSEIGFPVMPCTGDVQGMMVPAFNSETGFPVMSRTGKTQGVTVPAFKPASTQTVAARVRRKKISDKTQELATLIPGGSRMNTAEMLLAAFKYVKFLQAQIGILSLMDSEEAKEVPIMIEEYMRELLGSTNVQEILSANGMCLVPIKLAMNWNKEMKSNNVVSRDPSHFVQSINNQDNALS